MLYEVQEHPLIERLTALKILWLSHRDLKNPASGGAERALYEIGRRLVSKGHSFTNITVCWNGSQKRENINGIDTIRLPGNLLAHFIVPVLLRKLSFDIVVDDLGHAVPWMSELIIRKPGVVLFYHLHRRSLPGQVPKSLGFLISSAESMYKFAYQTWPFITVSETSISDLMALGIERKRINKIPLGVDLDIFKPGIKQRSPQIVYFGGMRDYKRPWEAIYAVKPVLQAIPAIKLIIIGSGPSLDKVRMAVKECDMEKNVELLGKNLNHDELANLLSSSWLNIHSSVTEGFGLSILEAAASGVPTVAYNVPGVSETIKQGQNGILVDDDDIQSMTQAIKKILDEYPGHWVETSRSIAAGYSWDRTAKLWEDHLETIIDQQ